ncbi:methyltransferase domain-containing protein [Gottfriedia acidiceleris]|uniref:methyltransferase domain-containing protein n=1 Tax=Gottfriedia acidiceleris TaxID=371036 RepID=UPI003D20D22F
MVRQHQPETLWIISLLENLLNYSVLELGCGAGNAMKLVLDQSSVNQIVGLDISPTAVNIATIRNRKAIHNGKALLGMVCGCFLFLLHYYLNKQYYSFKDKIVLT